MNCILSPTLIPILILCIFSTGIFAQTVQLISEGSTLYQFNTYTIDISGFPREQKKVTIELLQNNSVAKLISPSASRTINYRWYIDAHTKPGNDYRLKITGKGKKPISCLSDKFFLKEPILKVTSPAAGDEWVVSDSTVKTIKWQSSFLQKQHFTIALVQSGAVRSTLAVDANCFNQHSVMLTPQLKFKSAQNYRIRVSLASDSGVGAYSDPFSIYRKSYKFANLNGIPLVWSPGETNGMALDRLQLAHYCRAILSVTPFTDERANTTLIGENIEDEGRGTVTTNESVADWCRDILVDFLGKQHIGADGMAFTSPDSSIETGTGRLPDPLTENHSIRLSGNILEFFVTESSTYQARILIEFILADRSGRILWKNIIRSKASNWGSSYQAINYYETLSNAYADIIVQLFSDPALIGVLRSN